MPTEPNQDFIPRKIDNKNVKHTLGKFSTLIEETVDFASQVFKWCMEKIDGKDEKVPILMSFRHIFELVDAISILIKYSCADPCKILLRAIFESTLNIEYILEKDSERRGMDFMVCFYHDELKFYRRWDPNDQMCKEFREKIRKDKVLKKWKLPEFPEIKNEIAKRKEIFKLPTYQESEEEFQRTKKKLKKLKMKPKWYTLHDGPTNIEKLAEHLERPGFYQILYRHWSPVVHGTDLIRGKISLDESGVYIHQIRLPTNAQDVTKFTLSFALMNINNFVDFFVPEKKEVAVKWYKDEIKDLYLGLQEKDIIKVK
jgi:hypothetical protein